MSAPAPSSQGYNPIVPPLPTFASTIRSQDRSSLASNRRSGSQYSSDEIHDSQEDNTCKPTYSQLSDFEFLRRSKSTDLPPYRSQTERSSLEFLRNKASPWDRRAQGTPDLERGPDTEILQQAAYPHYVNGRAVFPSLVEAQRYGFRSGGGGIRARWRARWHHWTGNQSRRRKIVLVLEIVLAGLIVGIIMGLAFGVIEDSVPRNNPQKYYTKPEYLGHGSALR